MRKEKETFGIKGWKNGQLLHDDEGFVDACGGRVKRLSPMWLRGVAASVSISCTDRSPSRTTNPHARPTTDLHLVGEWVEARCGQDMTHSDTVYAVGHCFPSLIYRSTLRQSCTTPLQHSYVDILSSIGAAVGVARFESTAVFVNAADAGT